MRWKEKCVIMKMPRQNTGRDFLRRMECPNVNERASLSKKQNSQRERGSLSDFLYCLFWWWLWRYFDWTFKSTSSFLFIVSWGLCFGVSKYHFKMFCLSFSYAKSKQKFCLKIKSKILESNQGKKTFFSYAVQWRLFWLFTHVLIYRFRNSYTCSMFENILNALLYRLKITFSMIKLLIIKVLRCCCFLLRFFKRLR